MSTLGTQVATIYGHRWRLALLWFVEACAVGAAFWTLAEDPRPRTLLTALAYFLLCGAALALPAHVLRLLLTALPISRAYRLLALQLFLAFAAATTTAALSTERGWTAIVCILLVGNALWALELELRVEPPNDARGT
jgi:hypothetical protein